VPSIQFKGKSVVETYHHSVAHHRLEFDAQRSLLGKGGKPRLDGNLIIEGDNLLTLKSLLPTHAGKVRCIYIDPPYNTGDESWVYSDNLAQPQFKEWIGQTVGKEGEDATRHDKWACMMMPRLFLLKELLHKDGAMFISIDDNEYHLLRSLLDEIFGRNGFVATLIWQKRYSRDNRPAINAVHDYVVVVAESEEAFKNNRNTLPPDENQLRVYRNPNNDPRGRWRPIPMTAQGHRKNQMYKIETPTGVVHEPPPGRCWSTIESEYKKLLKDGTNIGASKRGRIWFGKDGNASPGVIRYMDEIEGFVPWTWLPHEEAGHTDEAKKQVHEILGTDLPTTPKPTRLIKRILQMYTRPDAGDIVLDAFAGTGTTAHAVLEMNKLDDGNRRFVLVQQPYETKEQESAGLNICERVTAERVRRVITGYSFKGTTTETLLEERLNLASLRNATEILGRIDALKELNAKRFDEVRVEAKDCIVRVIGAKKVKQRTDSQ
jgi:adenine-specific DNA-methyltransferase